MFGVVYLFDLYVDTLICMSVMRKKAVTKSKKSPPVKVRRYVKKSVKAPREKVVRSPEWLEEEKVLKMEAFGVLLKSRILLSITSAICDAIDEMIKRKDSGKMSWMEQEKWYEDAETLNKKIIETDKLLRELDNTYEDLRKRVNKFYGEEVMRYKAPYGRIQDELEEEDKADWWKRDNGE